MTSVVNPNESLYSSGTVAGSRGDQAVGRSLEMVKYSVALVLWERGLIPEFATKLMTLCSNSTLFSFMKTFLLDFLNF